MSGKAIRETLGFIAVVASLVFVGLEIRQNNVQARAAARQGLAEISIQMNLTRATDRQLDQDVLDWAGASPDDVLDCRSTRACGFVFAALRFHENVFLQVAEGVLDESAQDSYSYREAPIYRSLLFAQYWPSLRSRFDPDFVAAFEAEHDLGS